jgi:putative FmdB family regulatory protein
MPTYEYLCDSCETEWEDICSWKDPVPDVCPECGEAGSVRKLISLPSLGIVELTGHELKAKLRSDGQKMMREAATNENLCANLVGESKYAANVSIDEKIKKERPKIKSSKKSA